ncbi:ParE-like toxin of type II toxin-antitoxin system [Candidatus Cyrtobacter comes]|uniref:Putative mRNA interferase YoeB n=1 Tax=Candidatus Cyrtobacter comes TaxID=675776 RepID=A0ABU5L7F9_9RICK|nr:Txe/YoeB family addiction module toxin [Candidatus Cyrtobacter comes]MDZ5762072.1 ParE-like toxin of type II toxin-antitoxin system [Candidatus Cyrtobacter comes]
MMILWSVNAWEDYLYWQSKDKKTLKRVNILIKDIMRNPFSGLGEPEALRHSWSGYFSRRIDREHRLVYTFKDNTIIIAQCRYHY